MIRFVRRRQVLRFGVASGVLLHLPPVQAHEYFTRNFTLVHPWTRASAPGQTSAMVCMRFEEVTESDRLVGASTPLAEAAEMGGAPAGTRLDIPIPKGEKTELLEAGANVRLLGLRQPMELGREYPITLVFAGAGQLQASFLVDYEAKA